jgi:hypothetical protein
VNVCGPRVHQLKFLVAVELTQLEPQRAGPQPLGAAFLGPVPAWHDPERHDQIRHDQRANRKTRTAGTSRDCFILELHS